MRHVRLFFFCFIQISEESTTETVAHREAPRAPMSWKDLSRINNSIDLLDQGDSEYVLRENYV